jgi:hypothetical protein
MNAREDYIQQQQEVFDAILDELHDMHEKGLLYTAKLDDLLTLYKAIDMSIQVRMVERADFIANNPEAFDD